MYTSDCVSSQTKKRNTIATESNCGEVEKIESDLETYMFIVGMIAMSTEQIFKCTRCSKDKKYSEYPIRSDNCNRRSYCKECMYKPYKEARWKEAVEKKSKWYKRVTYLKTGIKKCDTCGEEKPLSEFNKRADTENSYRDDCYICMVKHNRENYRNNPSYRKRTQERWRERIKEDPRFAMRLRLLRSFNRVFKSIGEKTYSASQKSLECLGCSLEEFKVYIERQFTGDMSWDKMNFQIDHKIPVTYFDLTNPEHVKKCYNYTNLQPLSKEDNLKKGNKILPEHMEYLKSLNIEPSPYFNRKIDDENEASTSSCTDSIDELLNEFGTMDIFTDESDESEQEDN